MSKESYTAWLRHRTECSDKALRTLGLTQKSEPIDKALLEKARMNRAYHAALGYDSMEWSYIDRISKCMEYLESLMMRGQLTAAAYDKAVKLLKGKSV